MTVSLYVYKRWIKSHLRTFLTIQEKVLKRSEQFKSEGRGQQSMYHVSKDILHSLEFPL